MMFKASYLSLYPSVPRVARVQAQEGHMINGIEFWRDLAYEAVLRIL